MPAGIPVVADPKPPGTSGFIMRSLEPFVPMSESQANRCYGLIVSYATGESLQKRTAAALGKPAAQDKGYPRLLVSIAQAELRPQGDGVAFVLRASAQNAASAEKALRPSTHTVRTPVRKPEEWLASDSELLRADLEKAMDVLAASIAAAYR